MFGVIIALVAGTQATAHPSELGAPSCTFPFVVEFHTGSASLTPYGRAVLDNAVPGYVRWNEQVAIRGHADTVGRPTDNLRLSRRRAEAVANYLARRGVSRARMRLFALGESELLVPTPDETAERMNRVVITLNLLSDEERIRRRTAEAEAGHPNLVC